MKDILILTAVLLFGCIKVSGQEVTFGAKIGGNYAMVTGDNSNTLDPLTAVVVGAMAELKFTEKISFQPEVIFSRQGFKSDELTLKIKYVNLPLIAKYYVIQGLSIEAGPQVGFQTVAIAETPIGMYDARRNIKRFDLGVNAGIGYKLDNGLNFSARYNHGFTNINKYVGEKISNQNAVVQVTVGYFFF